MTAETNLDNPSNDQQMNTKQIASSRRRLRRRLRLTPRIPAQRHRGPHPAQTRGQHDEQSSVSNHSPTEEEQKRRILQGSWRPP